MKILLVDDHTLFREGLASLLKARSQFTIVGEANNVREAIALTKLSNPDIILMDFSLPDGTGLDATREILRQFPSIVIVFLTIHDDNDRLFAAIREGAKGYLLKNTPVDSLISQLEGVVRGEAALSPRMTTQILDQFTKLRPHQNINYEAISNLTARELEVLRTLELGVSNQDIAEKLFISERTVKNHVSRILAKLKLKNRYEAAHFAKQHGIVYPQMD